MAHQTIYDLFSDKPASKRKAKGLKEWFFNAKTGEARDSKPLMSMIARNAWEVVTLDHEQWVSLQEMNPSGTTYFSKQPYSVTVQCKVHLPAASANVSLFLDELGADSECNARFSKKLRTYVQKQLEDEKGTLEDATQDPEKLGNDCAVWIEKTFGLMAVVNIEVDSGKMELSLSAFTVSTKASDHIKGLTPHITGTFKGRAAKERKPLREKRLETIVAETVDEYMRRSVSLQQYQFESGPVSEWKAEVQNRLRTRLDDIGWDIEHFVIEVPQFVGYSAESEQETHHVSYPPPEYGQNVTVECTARIEVFDAALFESSGFGDKKTFLVSTADIVVKDELFVFGFTDLLTQWTQSKEKIKGRIKQAANAAGLSVGTIITRPNISAIDLLDGWDRIITSVKSSDEAGRETDADQPLEKYKTKNGKDLVDFEMDVTLVIADLSEIRDVLDQKKDRIGAHIRDRIKQTAAAYTRTRTTEDFYIRFEPDQFPYETPPDVIDVPQADQLPSFSEGVATAVTYMLRSEFKATKCSVRVTQDTGEVGKRYEELVTAASIEVPIRLTTNAGNDGQPIEPVYFNAMLRTYGVRPERWGTFQGYNWEDLKTRAHRARYDAMRTYEDAVTENSTDYNENGETPIQTALFGLQVLGLNKYDTVPDRDAPAEDIPLAELVCFFVAGQMKSELERYEGADLLFQRQTHKEIILRLLQDRVNKIASKEFGLMVEVSRFNREDTRAEVENRENAHLEGKTAREGRLLDLNKQLQGYAAQGEKNKKELTAQLIKLDQLNEALITAISKDNYDYNSPYIKDLQKQIDSLMAEAPELSRSAEHKTARIATLRVQLSSAEKTLDALPPPRSKDDHANIEQHEADVAYFEGKIAQLENDLASSGAGRKASSETNQPSDDEAAMRNRFGLDKPRNFDPDAAG